MKKNQAKLKEKPQLCLSEEALHCDEEVCHNEGCCSPRRRGSQMRKTILGFAAAKKLFAVAKRFATIEDVSHCYEGKIFEIPVLGSPW